MNGALKVAMSHCKMIDLRIESFLKKKTEKKKTLRSLNNVRYIQPAKKTRQIR